MGIRSLMSFVMGMAAHKLAIDNHEPVMPQTHVNTTLAKQLALFVILYSPLQVASDEIENYEANTGPFLFVCDCPTDWEKIVFPEAEINKYVTTARKEKGGNHLGDGSQYSAREKWRMCDKTCKACKIKMLRYLLFI